MWKDTWLHPVQWLTAAKAQKFGLASLRNKTTKQSATLAVRIFRAREEAPPIWRSIYFNTAWIWKNASCSMCCGLLATIKLTVSTSHSQVQNTDELTFAFYIEGKRMRSTNHSNIVFFLTYKFRASLHLWFIPRDPTLVQKLHISHEGEDEQRESGWMSPSGVKICGERAFVCYGWVSFF